MEPLDLLKEQVYRVHPLEDEAWQALSVCWEKVSFNRKQIISRAGDTEKYLYFVLDGIQRAYYLHTDKEATLVFSFSPSFSGVLDSFLTQTPSRFHLETITASIMLRMHHNDMMSLMQRFRCIETWVRIALSYTLAGTLERQVELLAFSAEEKFTSLLRRSPHVLNMIPHKYLASYIGVDPATFSKLLGTVKL